MRGMPGRQGPLSWVGALGAVGLAALLALVLLTTGLPAVSGSGLSAGWRWTLSALLVALHLTLVPPLVTRWPVVALAIGSACMLGLVIAPDLGGDIAAQSGGAVAPVLLPSGLVWFVLLYAVSSRTAAPWPSVGLAAGLVGSLLVLIRLWDSSAGELLPGPLGWRLLLAASLVGGTVAAWALGRYRATRLAWTAELADRAAAEERRRIAREMHDVVAHSLAVVVAQAEGGRMLAMTQPAKAPEILDGIATQGREALGQMRGLLGVLRDDGATSAADGADPGAVGDASSPRASSPGGSSPGASSRGATSRGGEPAGAQPPQPTLADLPVLVAQVRGTGRAVELETFGDPRRVDPATALTAYRIVQESLTNVVKHAGSDATARVTVDWTDELTLTITDDGAGVPLRAPGSGRGITGMRERVEAVGGTLSSGRLPRGGWRTCARIPA